MAALIIGSAAIAQPSVDTAKLQKTVITADDAQYPSQLIDQNEQRIDDLERTIISRYRDSNDHSAELVAITLSFLVPFAAIVFCVFFYYKGDYNRNKIRYDAVIKYAELGRDAPQWLTSIEQQKVRVQVKRGGSTPSLMLSIICGVISSIWLIVAVTVDEHGSFSQMVGCYVIGAMFAILAVLLYRTYLKRSEPRSNSDQEQQ